MQGVNPEGIVLEPFIMQELNSMSLSHKVCKIFLGLPNYCVGLALAIKQTSWIQPLLAENYDDPKVLAYITRQPVVDQQDQTSNFLVVLPFESCKSKALVRGLWMVTGVIVSDLQLLGPVLGQLIELKDNVDFILGSSIRSILTIKSNCPEDYFYSNYPIQVRRSLNSVLPVKEIIQIPEFPQQFLTCLLRGNILGNKNLNGMVATGYYQMLCEQINSNSSTDTKQLWQLTLENSARRSSFRRLEDLKPVLEEASTSEPFSSGPDLKTRPHVSQIDYGSLPLDSEIWVPQAQTSQSYRGMETKPKNIFCSKTESTRSGDYPKQSIHAFMQVKQYKVPGGESTAVYFDSVTKQLYPPSVRLQASPLHSEYHETYPAPCTILKTAQSPPPNNNDTPMYTCDRLSTAPSRPTWNRTQSPGTSPLTHGSRWRLCCNLI